MYLSNNQKIIHFPIWLTTGIFGSEADKKEFAYATFLKSYYEKKLNLKLRNTRLRIKYQLHQVDASGDDTLEKTHDRILKYVKSEKNVFVSFVNRIYGDSKKTLSKKDDDKIFFTMSDPAWNDAVASGMYDLTPEAVNNFEVTSWLSKQK